MPRTPRTISDSGSTGGVVDKGFDVNDLVPEQQPDAGQVAEGGRWPDDELPVRSVPGGNPATYDEG